MTRRRVREYRAFGGDLLPCCIRTLTEYDGPDREGDVIGCWSCRGLIAFRAGAWEWFDEPPRQAPVDGGDGP